MVELVSIRTARNTLMSEQFQYQSLRAQLDKEMKSNKAEASAAQDCLKPHVESFVAEVMHAVYAPTVPTLDQLLKNHGADLGPLEVREATQKRNAKINAKIADLTAQVGSPEILQKRIEDNEVAAPEALAQAKVIGEDVKERYTKLKSFDMLRHNLEALGHKELKPEDLQKYKREPGLFAHLKRKLTDPVYALAEPVASIMGDARLATLKEDMEAYEARRLEEARLHAAGEKMTAALQNDRSSQQQLAMLHGQLVPDEKILQQMQQQVVKRMLDTPALFADMVKAFPQSASPEMRMLHTRAQLFSKIAETLASAVETAKQGAKNLNKPLDQLASASLRLGAIRTIPYRLDENVSRMRRQRVLLAQRVKAAQDIRARAAEPVFANFFYTDNSTTTQRGGSLMPFIAGGALSYLLFANPKHAEAAPAPVSSGQGGDFSGAGATDAWEAGPPADNSFFRADLLGVTPDNVTSFGLLPSDLQIAPVILSDLGIDARVSPQQSDFNALGAPKSGLFDAPDDIPDMGRTSDLTGAHFASARVTDVSSFDFNNTANNPMQFDRPSLDVQSLGSTFEDMGQPLEVELGDLPTQAAPAPSYTYGGGSSSRRYDDTPSESPAESWGGSGGSDIDNGGGGDVVSSGGDDE